ncbi:MAG: OmpA family protein [Gammaproteobacteria bacterium]|nr:OmpA family protein [Gammaproteobacteria bacterium]
MNCILKRTTMSMLGALVLLSACTTLDPYTHEEKTSSATKGALIGAASGIAIGLMTGDDAVERRQYALIGAGVGAIAGGSVGAYMDNQELALRKKLEGTGVSVTRDGDNITLVMPSNVTFATDSSDLRPEFFGVLDSVNLVLKEYDKTVIEVAGHTDSTGTEKYNQSLSERRAATVATYLINRGVLEMRVITIGMGETRPVADNSTEAGRAMNRRVELTLVPVTQ